MEIVIDTNVLVSGLLHPQSCPGEIVDMVMSCQLIPVSDDRILLEYEVALKRNKFSFNSKESFIFITFICKSASCFRHRY